MLRNRPTALTLASSRFSTRRQVARTRSRPLYCTSVPNFTQLRAALQWEEDGGFKNSQGRNELFTTFVRRALADLEIPSKFVHQKQRVLVGITYYDSLDVPNRESVVQNCRDLFDEVQSSHSSNGHQDIKNEKSMKELHKELFHQTAERLYMNEDSVEEDLNGLQQGSEKWREFRKNRLTASTFSKVLGMFNKGPSPDAHELWLEKLDLKEPFKGNEMTRWGSRMEKTALEGYHTSTGNRTEHRGVGVLGKHRSEDWIAGSPDGLVQIQDPSGLELLPEAAHEVLVPTSSLGLLEIKCPFGGRKGPQYAQPPDQLAAYYIPQIQGLMEIFDRDWCHLYYWTMSHGAKLFLVYRDQQYWNALYEVLAQFWWEHVIPAKLNLEHNEIHDRSYEGYRPQLETSELIAESQRLAKQAPQLQWDNNGHWVL